LTNASAALAWIVLLVFGTISAYVLFVGMTFGFSVGTSPDPAATWLRLGVIGAPLPVAFALKWHGNSGLALLLSIAGSCALFSPYAVTILNR